MNAKDLFRPTVVRALIALVIAIGAAGLFAGSDTAHAQAFNPEASYGLSDTTPGAVTDVNSEFSIDAPDVQFGGTINFTPPEFIVAADTDLPDGAIVAQLSSDATLGLLGGACNDGLKVIFNMLDATTDKGSTVPFNDPEEFNDPGPDTNDSQGSEPDDQFDLESGGLPLGVTRYPDYLARIFEGLTPKSRLYGQTTVGGIEVSLNFLLFEPATVFEFSTGTVVTDPRLGYPSVTVLQSAGDPDTEASAGDANAVSDFCTPLLAQTTVYGTTQDNPNTSADEGGVTIRKNPDAGTYPFVLFARSSIDTDGDGIENALDPCPTIANNNWDPRIEPSDADYTGDNDPPALQGGAPGDGLPDEVGCDPDPNEQSPTVAAAFDEDGDQYGNRSDNCALVANSQGQVGGSGPDNQEDSDADGIGDQCDPNPDTPDGDRAQVCLVSKVVVGGQEEEPSPPPQDLQPCGDEPLPTSGQGNGDTTDDTTDGTTDGTDGNTGTAGGAGGPATGVGSLAPAASSIPTWATIASGLGLTGLLGGLGTFASRIFGFRIPLPFRKRE